MWEIEYTDEFDLWWSGLSQDQQEALDARVTLLVDLGSEFEATRSRGNRNISTSEHERASSLPRRRIAGSVCFRPARHAILLLGGDKSGEWSEWYLLAVPHADDL